MSLNMSHKLCCKYYLVITATSINIVFNQLWVLPLSMISRTSKQFLSNAIVGDTVKALLRYSWMPFVGYLRALLPGLLCDFASTSQHLHLFWGLLVRCWNCFAFWCRELEAPRAHPRSGEPLVSNGQCGRMKAQRLCLCGNNSEA